MPMPNLDNKFRLPRAAIVLVLLITSFLSIVSCKEDKTAATTDNEIDTGIHEKFERGPALVILDIDRKEITIAERLNLTIGVTVDEDYEVDLPGFGENLEQFGIVDYHTTQPELLEDNKTKISRSYVLEPFLSGDYKIPAMEIKFWKKGEEESGAHTIETSEAEIKVKSLLPEDLKDVQLNDIKPPVDFPSVYRIWLWAGIGVAVIFIAAVALFVFIKRRKRAEIRSINAKILAHELAYEELRKLVSEDLPNKGEIKLFYQRISSILRHYIENRFGINAPEQTTDEFLAGLEAKPDFALKYRMLLNAFLRHCDLVKFAEHQPQTDDIQKTFDSCKAFIEETKDET
jgi:hypothetical protein